MTREQPAAPKGGLPIITFDHDVTVHLNGEDIRALHFPGGHTDGDAIVFFPKANVVNMGDDFVRYGYPFIDVNSAGIVQGMLGPQRRTRILGNAERIERYDTVGDQPWHDG